MASAEHELRRRVDAIAASELQRASARLAGLSDEQRAAVAALTSGLSDAIVHALVSRVRVAAACDERLQEAAAFFLGAVPAVDLAPAGSLGNGCLTATGERDLERTA